MIKSMKKNYIEKLPDTVKSLKITRLPLSDEEEKDEGEGGGAAVWAAAHASFRFSYV